MRKFFVIACFGFIIPVAAQESYSLQQCIEVALQNNLSVKSAELALQSTELDLKTSKASVLPSVNAFANHNYNWGQRIDPFTNQFANTRVQSNSFGISSSVDLFNGFRNQQNTLARQAAYDAGEYDLEAQKNQLKLDVTAAYIGVLLADDVERAAREQVRVSSLQLERIKKLVEAGSVNVGAQYDLEAQLASENAQLVARQNEKRLAMLRLKQLMLLDDDTEIQLEKPASVEIEEVPMESASTVYSSALQSMPEIKSAQLSIIQWEKQINVARSGRYPSLSLSGSIGTGYSGLRTRVVDVVQSGSEPIGQTASGELVYVPVYDTEMERVPFSTQLNDNFNQFVGLSLSVPIFNRFQVSNNVAKTRINRSLAELELEQRKQQLRQRIESAHADALAARLAYESSVKATAAAERALAFATARFEAGALNVTDYNIAKANYLQAQIAESRAKFDALYKRKLLEFYMGLPLEL
ncbi:MAG: TolC family protein [Salibacteraceae bacterium]